MIGYMGGGLSVRSITGFVGLNGSGKSLAIMDLRVRRAFEEGRHVLSNVPLTPERLWPDGVVRVRERGARRAVGRPVGTWEWLVSLEQLERVGRGTLIVLDDVSAVFPARGWASMPAGIHALLQQLRKVGAELCWSAPTWERVDTTIRELTQDVIACKGFLYVGGVWGRARFVLWRRFEVSSYLAKERKRMPGSLRMVRMVPGRLLYDSSAVIEALSHLDGEGVCIRCGGNRRRSPCKCGPGAGLGEVHSAPGGRGSTRGGYDAAA